jgi:hypothetical protein
MEESRKGRQPQPKNLTSSYELTSAFRHSERLNEQRELVEKVSGERAVVGDDGARPKTNDAKSPKGQANNKLPTTLAGVRRLDVEAEEEDEAADEVSRKRAVSDDRAHPETHHNRKPKGQGNNHAGKSPKIGRRS